jgi:chromosome segregation ATPase
MRTRTLLVAGLLTIAAAGAAAAYAAPAAVEERGHSPAQPELLQEVRALRVAIERFTVAGARAQLLLGRLQMQEERVTVLTRQAQEIRARLLAMQRDRETNVTEIKALSATLNDAAADERARLSARIDSMRRQIKRFDQQLRDLEAQDATISSTLAAEHGRWQQFNDRLEELERMLAGEARR